MRQHVVQHGINQRDGSGFYLWAWKRDTPSPVDKLPATAPLKDWNIIEATHIYDGPQGIIVPAEANYNILKKNAITVDGQAAVIDDFCFVFQL